MFCTFYEALSWNAILVPHTSHYLGKAEPSTENELRMLACCIVHTEYMTIVGASEQHVYATEDG